MAIQSRTAEQADELTPNACDTSVIPIEIKILGRGDDNILTKVAPGVFDHAVDCHLSKEFLGDPRHHLAVAMDAGFIVGFASAVHYVHPDKGPELWINEVGVASTHQGRGLATKLLQALFEVGRTVCCTQAWVLTDRSNAGAMRLYSSAGGIESQDNEVMYTFPLTPEGRNEAERLDQSRG
ncbi:MAG: GNAT family N-acetyltransferase [Verrucomicrobia bacterium]|nr:GNAT family N-acetyltransferase [Verrucomicrobiota bacterium]